VCDGEGVRINTLWMPHARITFKSTKLITYQAFRELFDEVTKAKALSQGAPTALRDGSIRAQNVDRDLEWSYDLLVATWFDNREQVYRTTAMHAFSSDPPQSVIHVNEALAATREHGIVTYSHDISEDESAYRQTAP
jgi:hypothetical protein